MGVQIRIKLNEKRTVPRRLGEANFGQTMCLNPKPLTKINCHSQKMNNNCLSTKSDVIVID